MPENFADRLLHAIEQKGAPVCVGLDPVYERIRESAPESDDGPGGQRRLAVVQAFCERVLEIVAPIVPAVKLQSAHFERYAHRGVELYFRMIRRARELGLLTIGDVKRGDIGSTAAAYAEAHLAGEWAPDAITVNGYFGADGLAPFIETARDRGRGLFVLVRTSNPSAARVQDVADADGTAFHERLAAEVARLGDADALVGERGYSCVGAVVAATAPDEARRLRDVMPRQVFLVPGYGAQGATAADCAAAFKPDGAGAIVNASRSVLYAHERDKHAGVTWEQAVERAARAFAEDIRGAVGG
jgi:orotidine-5'-phosphate decarboxylase